MSDQGADQIEPFPDLTALDDHELKLLVERKIAEEREVSMQRRVVHGQLDLLRRERVERLKERYGDDAELPPDDG